MTKSILSFYPESTYQYIISPRFESSALQRYEYDKHAYLLRFVTSLVQSLNSPFFPPLIGAEPGRTKEESRVESRITCMRMLRTPPVRLGISADCITESALHFHDNKLCKEKIKRQTYKNQKLTSKARIKSGIDQQSCD